MNFRSWATGNSVRTMISEQLFCYNLSKTVERVYLDNAAAALYSKSHVEKYCDLMKNELLSNPHSGGLSGLASLDMKNELINQLRKCLTLKRAKNHNEFHSSPLV